MHKFPGLILAILTAVSVAAAPAPDSAGAPIEVAGPPVPESRVQAIPVLEGHAYAVPRLVEGLEHETPQVRARCCFLLGQIATDDVVEPLLAMQDDPDREVREFAGISLTRMGDERGEPAARAALSGNRWWVRFWALDAIARQGVEPVVRAMLDDPDPLVRKLAEDALRWDWQPARAETIYESDADWTLDELIYHLTDYFAGETDWWWHAGDYPQILRALETAIWLDPGWGEAYGNAGYLYWSLGRNREALGAYRRGVVINPHLWETNFDMGFHYFNVLHDYEKAAHYLGRARELGCPPQHARMHAHALEKTGDLEGALQVFRELAEADPRNPLLQSHIERLEQRLREKQDHQ